MTDSHKAQRKAIAATALALHRRTRYRLAFCIMVTVDAVLAGTSCARASETVPVVICKEETMARQTVSVHAPPYVTATVSPALLQRIAFYAVSVFGNDTRRIGVFGPRGWHCHAHSGTGGESVFVFPDKTDPFFFDLHGRIGEVFDLQLGYGGHFVEVLKTGAPLFTNLRAIARTAEENPQQAQLMNASPKQLEPYSGERVAKLGEYTVRFCDPPGVNGTGSESGGDYPSCGVVKEDWNGSASQGKAYVVVPDLWVFSVALPTKDASLANELLKLNAGVLSAAP